MSHLNNKTIEQVDAEINGLNELLHEFESIPYHVYYYRGEKGVYIGQRKLIKDKLTILKQKRKTIAKAHKQKQE